MNILVTGGTGYIGSHTVVELLKKGHSVDIVDNLCNSKREILDKIKKISGIKPNFFCVDLLDEKSLEEVFRNKHYDLVIHFAGLKAVGESVSRPIQYYKNNVGGTINLLEKMKKYNVKKIIFSSSATVYGDQKESHLKESMKTGSGITNPYGKTKFMIEEILKDVARSDKDFSVTILRYFNPIGNHPSGEIGEDPNGMPNNLMPVIMKVARGELSELDIFGTDYPTRDGTCVRDYVHVVDLAKGHVAAIEGMKEGVSIYNLGTGTGSTVLELIAAFEKASGKKIQTKNVARRSGDLAELIADPSKVYSELGWTTELSIEDAMKDTVTFLNEN